VFVHSCHYFLIEVSQASPASRRWGSAFTGWVFKPRGPRTGLPNTVFLKTRSCLCSAGTGLNVIWHGANCRRRWN